MALYLVVKSGSSQGESYKLADGMIVGRRGAQIKLNDPKVSSSHAKIETTPEGLKISDLGSKNGITVDGQKVPSLLLKPGVEFNIGESLFQVIQVGEDEPAKTADAGDRKGRRWNQILSAFVRKALNDIQNDPIKLEPMTPALVLDFLRGPQTETRWILGYGPRQVGRLSVDLPVFEEGAAPMCFEVRPTPQGVEIKSLSKEVRLNGSPFSTEILKVGDQIQILGTEIEVDFLE